MNLTYRRIVAVVGANWCLPEETVFAEELGRRLGIAGHVVLTGGRGGVMEAASRGARKAGGLTVGILPGPDPGDANPHVDVIIPTNLGELRNCLVAAAGEVMVAIGGEFGTLSEIALALKAGKDVVGWRTWDLQPRGGSRSLRPDNPQPRLPGQGQHAGEAPQGPRSNRRPDRSIIAVTSIDEACEAVERALSRKDVGETKHPESGGT